MRTFADGSTQPTESTLRAELGDAWTPMRSVLDLVASFRQDWNFSNGSGWMLKVHDGQKAVLYLTPLRGSFAISMAIREVEREALLADADLADGLHEQLECARRYTEGYALKFDVRESEDLQPVEPFLRALIRLRGEATL
jgi:Protein of unknown function (DUF3788)